MTDPASKPRAKVGLFTDEQADAVAAFFRAVWDPQATADTVLEGRRQTIERHPFFPGLDVPTVVFSSEEHVLGYCGSIPIRLSSRGHERRAEWIKGLMVLPSHRNGPIGFALAKELLRHLDLPLSLVVGEPTRRLLGALGMTDLGAVPNFLRPLDTPAILEKLDLEALGLFERAPSIARGLRLARQMRICRVLGICIDAGIRLRLAAGRGRASEPGLELSTQWPSTTELDGLWRDVKSDIAAGPVRNGRYLTWRYGGDPSYGIVAAREKGRLRGVAIVRRPRDEGDPRLKGIQIAVVSDLLFSPAHPRVASSLLRGTDAIGKEFGAEALLCSASHACVVSLLPRHGYMRVPANLHLLVATPKDGDPLPRDLAAWWITRGDSNADEVF
jgi:hypothetical protein